MKKESYQWFSSEIFGEDSIILGAGKAGIQILDQLVLSGMEASLLAIDTDSSILNSSLVEKKIILAGEKIKGVSSSGDEDLATEAFLDSFPEICESISSIKTLILCTSTGSLGMASMQGFLQLKKKNNLRILLCLVCPFSFESRNSARLEEVQESIFPFMDKVFLFPNDVLSRFDSEISNTTESFLKVNRVICEEIKTLYYFSSIKKWILGSGFEDFKKSQKSWIMHTVSISTENRVQEIVRSFQKSSLLQTNVHQEEGVLFVVSDSDLQIYEVNLLLEEIKKVFPLQNVTLNLAADDSAPKNTLRVSLFLPSVYEKSSISVIESASIDEKTTNEQEEGREKNFFLPKSPEGKNSQKIYKKFSKKRRREFPDSVLEIPQEEFDFPELPKGRFSKRRSNLFNGEDLDVPTFLRKKEKL